MSAILKAAKSNNPAEVLKAIADGADVNEKAKGNGQTALTLACEFGNLEIVKILLDAGANPNLKGELGYTPLMCAAASFDKAKDAGEICQLLMQRGADIDLLNDDAETTLEVLLLAPGKNPDHAIAELFVREMLRKRPKCDFSKVAFLVIDYGHPSTLHLLVKLGLSLESVDRFGYSLLHAACRRHALEMLDVLLESGADPNIRPKLGWADHPFDLACRYGRLDWIGKFLFGEPKMEITRDLLETAVSSAIECGRLGVLDYLESSGILPPGLWLEFNSAIFTAASHNQVPAIDYLLVKGIGVDCQDAGGNTPLFYASYHGKLEVLKVLLERGANPNALNNLGWNALMQASASGSAYVAEYLILKGCNINQRCIETGATALFIAATEGHADLVKVLMRFDADSSIVAEDGKTAATSAKAQGHDDVVKLLGGIQSHFQILSRDGEYDVCAFCTVSLNDPMAQQNYCPQCHASYCEKHFPWKEVHLREPSGIISHFKGACPNGHVKWRQG